MSLLNRADVHEAVDILLNAVDNCQHRGKQLAMAKAVEKYFANLADVMTKISMIRDSSIAPDAQVTVAEDGTVVIISDVEKE